MSDDLHEMNEVIDWPVVAAKEWSNTTEDPDRKERKQAEFLAYRFVPLSCLVGIAVYSDYYRQEAVELAGRHGLSIPVRIMTGWYY